MEEGTINSSEKAMQKDAEIMRHLFVKRVFQQTQAQTKKKKKEKA